MGPPNPPGDESRLKPALGLFDAAAISVGAMAATGNSFAIYLVSLGAMIATASVLLMTVLGMSRMTFAMARNGQMPAFLSRLHPRFCTPHFAILATGLGACVLVFGGFPRAVAVGTFALLFHHGLANLAALRLSPDKRRLPQLIPALGFLSCASLLAFLSRDAWVIGLAGLALGSLIYALTMGTPRATIR